MTRAHIYCRYSPRRAADTSQSNVTQEAQCREHAAKLGLVVAGVYEDKAVSGDAEDKPGLEDAFLDLKKGDVLLVYSRCRLARDMCLALMVEKRVDRIGATIAAVTGDALVGNSPTAVLMRRILASFAEYEKALIGARTRAAMRSHQKAGRKISNHVPIGYMLDPRNHKRLVRSPADWPAVLLARKLAGEGSTAYAIAKSLDAAFPAVCRGVKWNPNTVAKILKRRIMEDG